MSDKREVPEAETSKSTENNPDEKEKVPKWIQQIREQLNAANTETEPIFEKFTIESVAKFIKDGKAKNIIVMTGAGISTSAGIPDFRSPGSGLYENLSQFNLPHPQAVFEIDYFINNPAPFFHLAKNLVPKNVKPTLCHYFIRLLNDKGLLLRTYTQNIDGLEHMAGIPDEKIVAAHGTYHTSTCMRCKQKFDEKWLIEQVYNNNVPRCKLNDCDGLVKPDVVFFGENLPERFFTLAMQDFPDCDLLLIMGTSLVVQPFCNLIGRVGANVPRLLINRDRVGKVDSIVSQLMGVSDGLKYDDPDNIRDIFWSGTCDDGVSELANLLEYGDYLQTLQSDGWSKIEDDYRASKETTKL